LNLESEPVKLAVRAVVFVRMPCCAECCRPRSGGSVAKKAPCIARSHSASSIGTHTTPTKHVLLTAARRKPSL